MGCDNIQKNDISQQFWTILSDKNCSMDSLFFELGHCINIEIEMAKNWINNTILRDSSLARSYADLIISYDDLFDMYR